MTVPERTLETGRAPVAVPATDTTSFGLRGHLLAIAVWTICQVSPAEILEMPQTLRSARVAAINVLDVYLRERIGSVPCQLFCSLSRGLVEASHSYW